VLSRKLDARLDYGDLRAELGRGGARADARAIADAVIRLRRSRLPDPAAIGNAGSFFKNPVIGLHDLARLRRCHPDLPSWPAADGRAKVPAAWLIERTGWKGYRDGDAGVHDRHALVLVNHGAADGDALLALSRRIAGAVQAEFGVRLEPEPVIVGAAVPRPSADDAAAPAAPGAQAR
jgi:UDP-N-acetylmuramate dehydrogenase